MWCDESLPCYVISYFICFVKKNKNAPKKCNHCFRFILPKVGPWREIVIPSIPQALFDRFSRNSSKLCKKKAETTVGHLDSRFVIQVRSGVHGDY